MVDQSSEDPEAGASEDSVASSEIPVGEESAEEVFVAEEPEEPAQEAEIQQLVEACKACGTLMDVTNEMPFAEVFCPSCGQNMRVRKQFNNFTLIELLGEGGMGSVFKAVDLNLNRNVALKILKKELSTNVEERAKLEREARITASINHPHVVKVFSFGEDHGQFYLAMEIVGKGSLDDLMSIQRRVAEVQVLEVGIQIAEGLEAAIAHDMIHRDIKPGNILFADAHSAKLVDFGLAIIMDEEASARGEIWGTPYYIAPEKLDCMAEDFRSDIYSLGGTLFHALAGRPPYEAETASMVALKQLKSQPVSLQSFVPDVSSETAYVINRMLAKHPDDRYQSYSELIEHLSYARSKLMERTGSPPKPKVRVELETQETKRFTAFLSLFVLLAIVAVGISLFVFRDKIFKPDVATTIKGSGAPTQNKEEVSKMFNDAVSLLASGDYEGSRAEFQRISTLPGIKQPTKNWAILNSSLAAMMAGDQEAAAAGLKPLRDSELYSSNEKDLPLANFFAETARVVLLDKAITGSTKGVYSATNFESFALLMFGIKNWERGAFADANELFGAYVKAQPAKPNDWITSYAPLARKYVADYALLKPIEAALPNVKDATSANALMLQVKAALDKVQTGSSVSGRMQEIQRELVGKGASA